jgi:hypothetical protein
MLCNKHEFRENSRGDLYFAKWRKLILTCHFLISWSMMTFRIRKNYIRRSRNSVQSMQIGAWGDHNFLAGVNEIVFSCVRETVRSFKFYNVKNAWVESAYCVSQCAETFNESRISNFKIYLPIGLDADAWRQMDRRGIDASCHWTLYWPDRSSRKVTHCIFTIHFNIILACTCTFARLSPPPLKIVYKFFFTAPPSLFIHNNASRILYIIKLLSLLQFSPFFCYFLCFLSVLT